MYWGRFISLKGTANTMAVPSACQNLFSPPSPHSWSLSIEIMEELLFRLLMRSDYGELWSVRFCGNLSGLVFWIVGGELKFWFFRRIQCLAFKQFEWRRRRGGGALGFVFCFFCFCCLVEFHKTFWLQYRSINCSLSFWTAVNVKRYFCLYFIVWI